MLAEIYVEDLERIRPHGADEAHDGRTGVHALDERAEADCISPLRELLHLRGERDVVPGNILHYTVCRNAAVIQLHLNGTSRLVRHGDHAVKAFRSHKFENFAAQSVVPDGADGPALLSEAAGVIGEIGRGAAERLSRREHVPKDLADPYYCLFHAFPFFNMYARYMR